MIKTNFLIILLCAAVSSIAQVSPSPTDSSGAIHYTMEAAGIATGDEGVPFWFRTNTFGSMPLKGNSVSVIAGINRNYASRKRKLLDWGAGIEGRLNIGNGTNGLLTEAYIKGRLSIFQLKVGRSKDITGLTDSTLGSGSFSVAGNALGIPKVELSIPEYWSIPLTRGLLAVKGKLAHGWMGDLSLRSPSQYLVPEVSSYYHELSVYGRIGKPQWRLKFYGGVNHFAVWGNERKIYGDAEYDLNNFRTFFYIASGKPYLSAPTGTSKIGNHLGSVDQAISYEFLHTRIFVYHQFFYDAGGLYHTNNLKDGLYGISFSNKMPAERWSWNKIVIEYWGSKSQGGEPDAPVTPSGDEDYYNNYLYYDAWNYKNENIGNNFLTSRLYARTDLPNRPKEYVINNRVILLHTGLQATLAGIAVTGKFSYSLNYGTYGSSPWGNSTGAVRHPGPPPYFERATQFSGFIEAAKRLKHGYIISTQLAADRGLLLYNNWGAQVKFSKSW